ncbi:hypothetical protein Cgig2_026685 [Carnegiea gigantea]|uniref:Uncharacterized protein n=1 Tax=Carnegiea gigantea TaxID=171969 RepID=A0A9Q1GMR1_9CARY|nr:hypothetical protein Cgig2_026685 [Carnegiea gigantea]
MCNSWEVESRNVKAHSGRLEQQLFFSPLPAPHPNPPVAPSPMLPLPFDQEPLPLAPDHYKDCSRVYVVIDITDHPEVVVVDSEHEEELGDEDELEPGEEEEEQIESGSYVEVIDVSSDSGTNDDDDDPNYNPLRAIRYLQRTNHAVASYRLGTNKSTWCASIDDIVYTFPKRQKVMEKGTTKTNRAIIDYQINLPNEQIVECSITYKDVPIALSSESLIRDLIQFDLSECDLILGMD